MNRAGWGRNRVAVGLCIVLAVLAAIAAAVFRADPTSAPSDANALPWERDLDLAFTRAAAEGKLVFMEIFAEWCGVCRKMESETLSQTDVQTRLGRYVLLKIDSDHDPEMAARYGTSVLPTLVVLDTDRTVLWRGVGFLTSDELLGALDSAEGKQKQ